MDDFARWLKRGDVVARVAAIRRVAGGLLGFAQLGVTSWEQDWMWEWERRPETLTVAEYDRLATIERRVFGE